MSEPVYCTKN